MFSVFTIFYCYIPVLVLVHSYILAEGTAKGVEKGRKGAERGGKGRKGEGDDVVLYKC